MPLTLRKHYNVKLLFAFLILAYLLFLYCEFLADLGDLYPDMIWDEVVSGLLGLTLVMAWYRATNKWLKR